MRIRHLETILTIVDCGSVSKASQQLHMTQSGLSRAIAELEEIVGGRLFERTGKGMTCTALGETMCRHARILLGDFAKAETDMIAVSRGDLGSLAVGCFSMFSGWPLAESVQRFRVQYPRVELTVQVGMHERMIEDLDSGRLDVLVSRSLPSLDSEIYRSVTLLDDAVILACSPGHPLALSERIGLADCVAYPWVTAPPQTRVRTELESFLRQREFAVPDVVGALSLEFALEMLASGVYLCMLPRSVAMVHQARGAVHVLPTVLEVEFPPLAAIWRRERSSTRHIREFAAVLASVVEEHSSA
ncbi:LysR family transcriptional regulator [Pigmentiphaga humi]|uniref:LysR family transcriptional regulator n=1 Tax=Pigmentiphaga humi TaxID=2478468 RepID=UPI001FEC6EBB|nr:LysR family transcriptional regulator [Pigmentiphaga humi]